MPDAAEARAADRALLRRIARLPHAERKRALDRLTWPQLRELYSRWPLWAHDGQAEPDGQPLVWMILAGRGFGKTRAGAEWISEQARRLGQEGRFALVGATVDDVRKVMIEGESGLLAVARCGETISWCPARGELRFDSGAVAHVYSASAAEKLRGPQHHAAWCDEIGKWGARGQDGWNNLMMGLRLGSRPRVLVTTTPRVTALVRKVEALAARSNAVTRGRTADNPHLPQSFLEAMLAEYAGTRLGRQELDGELLEDVEGALWSRALLVRCISIKKAEMVRVVVGVDPPASVDGDACGIVAVGLGRDGTGHVLEDASAAGLSPEGWARAVAACAARHGADAVVAEKNQGGDMVRSVLKAANAALPLRLVHASKGKSARAEPVSLLYEAGKVRHVPGLGALEDELCGMLAGGGYAGPGRSPDRADALVWAMWELMLGQRGRASVRVV